MRHINQRVLRTPGEAFLCSLVFAATTPLERAAAIERAEVAFVVTPVRSALRFSSSVISRKPFPPLLGFLGVKPAFFKAAATMASTLDASVGDCAVITLGELAGALALLPALGDSEFEGAGFCSEA